VYSVEEDSLVDVHYPYACVWKRIEIMRDVSSVLSTSVKVLRKTVTMSNVEFVGWHQDSICPGVFYFSRSGALIYSFMGSLILHLMFNWATTLA
jgi:hypothetical protein